MAIETVSFTQIATAVTSKGAVLYGLTASGVVYEYNYSRKSGSRFRCERFRRTDYRQTSSASAGQAGGARSSRPRSASREGIPK